MININNTPREHISALIAAMIKALETNPRRAEVVSIKCPNYVTAWALHRMTWSNLDCLKQMAHTKTVVHYQEDNFILMTFSEYNRVQQQEVSKSLCLTLHFPNEHINPVLEWPAKNHLVFAASQQPINHTVH